jgi:hypothetical protein
MMAEKFGEDVDRDIHRFMNSNRDEVENHAKSLYIELMGTILSQSE